MNQSSSKSSEKKTTNGGTNASVFSMAEINAKSGERTARENCQKNY